MKGYCHFFLLLLFMYVAHPDGMAQDSTAFSETPVSGLYPEQVRAKADKLHRRIAGKTQKTLRAFQQQQNRLLHALSRRDSAQAARLLSQTQERMQHLQQQLQQPAAVTSYVPLLDTLKTSLRFLQKQPQWTSGIFKGKLDKGIFAINGLEGQLRQADQVNTFLRDQQQLLRRQLENFGFARSLRRLDKSAYYYGAQIQEYKQLLKDKKRLERKTLRLLSQTKPFQDFMKKNSLLATLFRMPPDDPNDPAYLQTLAGLQTRTQVTQMIGQQIGASGPNAMQQMQNVFSQAQTQLQQLQDRLKDKIGGSSSDAGVPNFRPNGQKVKSFGQRIEWSMNMQSQRSNGFFPLTSDIGLSAGYKLNDRSVIGVGGSYRMGWGTSLRNMRITHEGVGLRSFADYQLKKTFWLTGGYEMNYRNMIRHVDELKNISAWQQSGLIGISKKLAIENKFLKATKVQVLWDFLSYRQVPRPSPFVFRVGYSFSSIK